MIKKCKITLTSLLTLLLLVFFMALPIGAAENSIIIYYQNTEGWDSVYCYIWQGTGPVEGTEAWPGAEMAKVDGTDNWYQIKYTAGKDFQVIFNNNGSEQTGNLDSDLKADKQAYWFIPEDDTTDKGTADGITPEGLSVQILTEAPEGFSSSNDTSSTVKDSSPKTGDFSNLCW